MSANFTRALKDGEYTAVSTFEPGVGLECRCICPECGGKVGSRIYSKRPESSSFFHASETSNCSGGQLESELHIKAKELLTKHYQIRIPIGGSRKAQYFNYSEVSLEKKIGQIRPDLILTNEQGNQLIVEIAVTSFCKDKPKKLVVIEELGIPVLEIDLSELYDEINALGGEVNKYEKKLVELIVEGISAKEWIGNSEGIYFQCADFEADEEALSKAPENVVEQSATEANWMGVIFAAALTYVIAYLFSKRFRMYFGIL